VLRRLALSLALLLATSAAHASTMRWKPARIDTATFAGGCFWSMEAQFEGVPGVASVVSGYSGGHKANPTYEEVNEHTTGHLETVEVRYDPTKISYAALLERFWHGIDPTQSDGQFCDIGESYQTAVFAHGAEQMRQATASKVALDRSHVLKAPVVTRIVAAGPFWPAEGYHQDFARKNPERYHAYRVGCGKDRRLTELWGDKAIRPIGY
jgi:peptide-methionine (S)-S-oxide reductase